MTKKQVQNRDQDNAVVSANEWFDTTYTYTTLGDLASITEEIDSSTTRTTSFDYDDEQQRIRVTKPEGNKVKTEYNERGLVQKVIRGETSGDASTREYFYDDNGNLIEEEDGRNYDTTHTYDLFDRKTRTTNAQSAYTLWTLDKRGQPTEIARKDSGDVTMLRQERFYDERGRLWKTEDLHKDPSQTYSDAVTTITRNKTGRVASVTDARSKTSTTTYDNAWRRTKVTDHAGNFIEWDLDNDGNPTAWTIHDEDGGSDVEHEYEATYDALGRRLTTVEIDRTNGSNTYTTTNGYDSRSHLVWQVDAEGNPTRWAYDGLGRMLTKDVALTVGSPITAFSTYIRTTWGFDTNDRLISHKDDAANETTWAYDALDRATTMTYADTSAIVHSYDAEDNVTSTLDTIGNDIDDTYDSLGRLTSRTVTRASGVLDTTTETFTYDAMDGLLTAEDDDYEVEHVYGVLGLSSNVYQEKQQYATGTAYLKTVTKKYDAVGNKTSETYPSTLALTYAYNDVNLVSTITNGANAVAAWTYSGLRRKQLTMGNGSKTPYTYGGFRSEVTVIDHQDHQGNSLLKLEYGYNKLHDRTFERYGASGQPGDAFEYDKARRLTVAWMGSDTPSSPSGNVYVKKIEYGMDDDGNRTTVTVTPYGSSPASTSYTDNSLNQYTVVGGVSRGHDGNGNVSDDGTYLYEYNYKNLIVRVKLKSNSSTVAEYKYDALGRRVEKVVGAATYRYIYSGVETVSVYTSTGTWKQDYVYGPNVDEVLMLEQADVLDWDGDSNTSELARSWYRANALGSIMRVEEQDKTEAVSYRYDPYGEVTITRGGTPQGSDPLGQYVTYTGRLRDEETSLLYYRARMYDPARGRFLQRDPLGILPGPSLYQYVSSRPSNLRDPSGMSETGPVKSVTKQHANGLISVLERGFKDKDHEWEYIGLTLSQSKTKAGTTVCPYNTTQSSGPCQNPGWIAPAVEAADGEVAPAEQIFRKHGPGGRPPAPPQAMCKIYKWEASWTQHAYWQWSRHWWRTIADPRGPGDDWKGPAAGILGLIADKIVKQFSPFGLIISTGAALVFNGGIDSGAKKAMRHVTADGWGPWHFDYGVVYTTDNKMRVLSVTEGPCPLTPNGSPAMSTSADCDAVRAKPPQVPPSNTAGPCVR